MSNKTDIQTMLVSMGFQPNYIQRAFKVYEKNYGHSYNVEVITEIIVRLQNKDKAKQKNKQNDKDKSPQPQKKGDNRNQSKPPNKASPSPSKPKPKPKPKTKPKQPPQKELPAKSSKNSKNQQPSPPKSPQQVNISANSNNMNKPRGSSPNKHKSPNQNQQHNNNNNMNASPSNYHASNNNNPSMNNNNPHNNNLPQMGGMSRSHSSGNRKNNKPMKPPNNAPLQNNNNNQVSPPKIHAKSQTVMSSQFVPARNSPVPPPPRYNAGDRVIYNGQEAEVHKVLSQNQIEITYPATNYIMQRTRATVSPQQLQRKKPAVPQSNRQPSAPHRGAMPSQQQQQPPPQQSPYNNNNNASHSSRHQHQYSQSQSNYPNYSNSSNPNMQRPQPTAPQIPLSQSPNVSIPTNPNKHTIPNTHNNPNNNNNAPPRNNKNMTPSSSSPNKPNKTTSSSSSSSASSNGSSNIPSFESHMTMSDANRLKIHDKIDHRDQVGRFVYATVSEKQGSNLKIHYDGWSRKWDTWSDFQKEIHRFAAAGSISKRPAHRFKTLKKGDYVDINPTQRHLGWKCGEIRRLDQKSGQVQVVYECADKNYLYWAHLDNKDEIAEFTSKSGTMHANQVDILQGKNQQQPQQQGQGAMAAKNQQQQQQQQHNQQPFYGQAPQGMNNKSMQQRPMQHMQGGQQQQFYHQQQGMYGQQAGGGQMDEMEAFERIRAKRFPRYQDEKIENIYSIGDWLEVQDTQTHQWITATVIDKENNWIVVHFDGWPSKYDQKIHAVKHQKRLRALGSGLQETQEEKDIKEEMNNFLKEVEQLNWKLVEVDADGNCLYRCFATEIYGDTNKHLSVRDECCKYMRQNVEFFSNFIPDFDSRMKEKEQEYEWGDHVDITALSELYNVRVRVFEYDQNQRKLYMSFDQGEHPETINLPLILLARHRKKHYNIIQDPGAVNKRPLKPPSARKNNKSPVVSLRELRLREDAKTEHKDDEKEAENDENGQDDNLGGNNKNLRKNMSRHNSYHAQSPHSVNFVTFDSRQFNLDLNETEFNDVLEIWNLSEQNVFSSTDLKNIFAPLLNKIKQKLEYQWENNHSQIDKQILTRFWKQQFEEKQQASQNCKRWIRSLREKVPNGQYSMNTCLNTFNQTIVTSIADNLGHIVATRKRESTIDIHRYQQQKQAMMDIDK